MIEQISKALYLGFGVVLLVIALTSFYENNQSLLNYNQMYKESRSSEDSWIRDANFELRNPLEIRTRDISVISRGLVYSGIEMKAQLLVMFNEPFDYVLYNEGVEVVESEYMTVYNNIVDSDEMLISVDESMKAVYIRRI